MDNYLKISLALKDPNLKIDNTFKNPNEIVHRNNIKILLWHLKTSPTLTCSNCSCLMNKNGFKLVEIKYDHTSDHLNILSVKKQKYICPNCKKTAIASIDDVRPNDHIALCVKRAIASELTESISKKYIGKRYFVSGNTVQRASNMWFEDNNRFIWLPQHISFDDFKSGKFAKASMSIVLINSVDHRILDIIKDRANLKNYFNRYSLSARRAVKTITVDLFSPYRKMISELFPNAIIIADRFHVVLQAYRALNLVRINLMKTFKTNSPEYRQLKRFNRLILKDSNELNYTDRKPRINYRHALLTDTEVIDRILALSIDLKTAYTFYQDILFGIKKRDKDYLLATIVANNTLPVQMKRAQKTIKTSFNEIVNSFEYGFSNGPVEGINNKIKVISRIAYGFRNFENFRQRILISFKNSYFAINYKKTTNPNYELVA